MQSSVVVAHLQRLCWSHNLMKKLSFPPPTWIAGRKKVCFPHWTGREKNVQWTWDFLFWKSHEIHHRIGHGVGFAACWPGILHGGGGWLSHQFRCSSSLLSQLCCSVGMFSQVVGWVLWILGGPGMLVNGRNHKYKYVRVIGLNSYKLLTIY